MLKYSFPFCAVSNFVDQHIEADITVTCKNLNRSKTKTVSLTTQSWSQQIPADLISFEFNFTELGSFLIDFEISIRSNKPTPILFFCPIINDTNTYQLVSRHQEIAGTEFNTDNQWHNLSLLDNQTATVTLEMFKLHDTPDDAVDFVRNKITFEENLLYRTQQQNKPELTKEENIEYYLGKDRYKNLFFQSELPHSDDIPPRPNQNTIYNSHYDTDQNIEYKINNLGYRADFDYVTKDLKNQRVIVCLGDSDVFGAYVEHNDIWTSQLQHKLPDVTVLNFGVRGISSDGTARLAARIINTLQSNIVAVCLHWPPPALREFVSKNFKCGVHTHRNYHLPYKDWWDHIDWHSNNYNYHKNRLLVSSMCASNDIAFYDLMANKEDYTVPYDFLQHGVYTSFGPATHTAIANYFYKKIANKPSLYQSLQS